MSSPKKYFSQEAFLDFIVGNIFVDASYLLTEAGYVISRQKTHFYEGKSFETTPFDALFLNTEYTLSQSDFNLGYYYHLVVDRVWRDSSFTQKASTSSRFESLYQLSRKVYA